MTVFGSKVLKAYVILMRSGAVPWWGGEGGTGVSPPPPRFFFFTLIFFFTLHFFFFFTLLFFFSFFLHWFLSFFPPLSAQSPVMYIDDNTPNQLWWFWHPLFSGRGNMCHSPRPLPPPFFFLLVPIVKEHRSVNLNPFPASCLYESRGQQARPRLALALFHS